MRFKSIVLYSLILLFSTKIFSQKIISIDEILEKIIFETDEYNNVQKNNIIFNDEYNIVNNIFLPKVSLEINAPNYDHSINVITQPNGDNFFLDRKQANSSTAIDIMQPIYFTGGYFNIKSSINRVDLLNSKNVNYSSNWFNIGFVQPLNGFNQFKWIKKVNDIKYKSNKINILKEIEDLKLKVIEKYFDVLILQLKIKLTSKNIDLKTRKINNLKELLKSGRVLDIDIIQEDISINQLKISLKQQANQFQIEVEEFKNILNLNNSDLIFEEPINFKFEEFNMQLLKEKIKEFGIDVYFEANLVEAESELVKAKRERGIQANLQLAYGANSANNLLDGLFETPSKREFVNLNIKIPILNWNENKRRMNIAYNKKEILENNMKIASEELDLKVFQTINYIESLNDQKNLYELNIGLINKNIEIATNLYEFNRVTLTDYDNQIFNELVTKVDFLSNKKESWLSRFRLRKLTLYDFYLKKSLL